jgi:hypothetical protein
MIDVSVTVNGLEPLLRKLNSLEAVYRPAVAESATHIKRVIATYPQQKVGRKQPPVSRKQRIFLIMSIREGRISVPHRRTGGLGRMWDILFRDSGKTAIVENKTPGAEFVQGSAQSAFHRQGGWKTDRQVANQEASTVKAIFSRHIAQWTME